MKTEKALDPGPGLQAEKLGEIVKTQCFNMLGKQNMMEGISGQQILGERHCHMELKLTNLLTLYTPRALEFSFLDLWHLMDKS